MKSVVLLSAGLDSTVSLAIAASETEVVQSLTFDYGQKASEAEQRAAALIADYYDTPHRVIRLDWMSYEGNALTGNADIPFLTDKGLTDADELKRTAAAVWVPNRNGVFINVSASIAEAIEAELIVAGFNAEEGETFPDNSPDFITASNEALKFSTGNRIRLVSFTSDLDKSAIVKKGLELKAPLDMVWVCYAGGNVMCGSCESCLRFKKACRSAGADYLTRGRFSDET